MGMLQFQAAPSVPVAPEQYDQAFMDAFSNVLRLFYNNINAIQHLNMASANFDLRTLPTDVDYANLRDGDIYRDTQGGTVGTGSNVLRIKVPTITFVALTGAASAGAVGTVTP